MQIITLNKVENKVHEGEVCTEYFWIPGAVRVYKL